MLLNERLNTSQLKSFSINGLFGFKNIKIPFDKEAVILIAENRSGKTTILNALYYSITCKFNKLRTIDFTSILLEFTSGISVEIKKSDLVPLNSSRELASELRPYLPGPIITELFVRVRPEHPSYQRRLENILDQYGSRIPSEYIEILKNRGVENHNGSEEKKIKKAIEENLTESVLYFPTYRRIEEDLKNLVGYDGEDRYSQLPLKEGEGEGKLIQFGMDDVIAKFNEIKTTIKNSALNLFSKVTGEILTQFVEGIIITQEMRDRIKPDTLNIVLSRVGEKKHTKI